MYENPIGHDRFFYLSSLCLLLMTICCGCSENTPTDENEEVFQPVDELKVLDATSGPIGLWRVPQEQEDAVNTGDESDSIFHGKPSSFAYDGEYVIMRLWTMKEWMWRSEDDYYRMKTEWDGKTLLYQPPFGQMMPLAEFDGSHFFVKDDTTTWSFERVGHDNVGREEAAALTFREPHNYDITPLGAIEPGWQDAD